MALPYFPSLCYVDRGGKRVDHQRNLSVLTQGHLSRSHRPDAPLGHEPVFDTICRHERESQLLRTTSHPQRLCIVLPRTLLQLKDHVVIA